MLLVKGQIQVGDSSFQPKASPEIPVAGDPDNTGPTYAQLNGKAKAVLSDGSRPVRTFKVTIHGAPAQSYVNNQGKVIVTSP